MNFLQNIDFSILDFIQNNLRSEFMDKLMIFITNLSNHGEIWIAIAVLFLLLKKYRKNGLTLSLALIINLIGCNLILKPLFQRPRPCDINKTVQLLINRPHGYSFPSGHTTVSFAAATVIYTINKKWGIASYILASLIAFSRLYLYVHNPSDILGGIIFGVLFAIIALTITDYINTSEKNTMSHK